MSTYVPSTQAFCTREEEWNQTTLPERPVGEEIFLSNGQYVNVIMGDV